VNTHRSSGTFSIEPTFTHNVLNSCALSITAFPAVSGIYDCPYETVEIRIRLSGGIEISEGVYWSMETDDTPIGFSLAIPDVNTQEKSPDNSLHHETWWAGKLTSSDPITRKKLWGLLVMTSKEKG
jgi:hypothetical protein